MSFSVKNAFSALTLRLFDNKEIKLGEAEILNIMY